MWGWVAAWHGLVLTLDCRYVGAEEIYEFYRKQAVEYGLYDHAKFNHNVIGAEWNEGSGKWTVTVQDMATGKVFEDSAEVVLNCAGVLK
jgi:cation diffusion facilitator CzcD-associated flavoprotein CzcO